MQPKNNQVFNTNVWPDGHVYLHAVPFASARPYTIFNRVEVHNVSPLPVKIGNIRFFPTDRALQGHYGLMVHGLDDQSMLPAGDTLMVYFFQSLAVGLGYQGVLDIPVLHSHTGLHAHIFTTQSAQVPTEGVGVRSGIFPVFIFEGLLLDLDPPKGEPKKVQPRKQGNGEHLVLDIVEVFGHLNGGQDAPPKPPRITTFFSFDPLTYAFDEVQVNLPQIDTGSVLPIIQLLEELKMGAHAMLDGIIEEMKYSTWPNQHEEDALKINQHAMLDGIIEEMKYSTWPNQHEEDALKINQHAMLDGTLETKTYTFHSIEEEDALHIKSHAMIGGSLEIK